MSDPTDPTDSWIEQAQDGDTDLTVDLGTDIEAADEETLLLAMQAAIGELSQAVVEVEPTSESDVDARVAELGGLLLRFDAAYHDRDVPTPTGSGEATTSSQSESQLSPEDFEDLETVNVAGENQDTTDDEVRDRVEQLVEQGVSSVSRISRIILKEFDNVDRHDVNRIASEVRDEAGEMETRGDPSDYVDHQSNNVD